MATAENQTQSTVETEAERRARIAAKIAKDKAEYAKKMSQAQTSNTVNNKLVNPITGVTTNSYPEEGKDVIGDPQKVKLIDSLVKDGYDMTKAQQLADMLLLNAKNQPTMSGTGGTVTDAKASQAAAGKAAAPDTIAQKTFADANASGIGIGNTEATTREVQEEELVSEQLDRLMEDEGPYLQRARQRAMELANARGSFGSSFAAGAAQRAAIDSALPIATADAQAYRDSATQNMNALNEFALANLNRATQIDISLLDANTRINMANLDASVRVSLANLDALTQTNIANLDAKTRVSLGNLQSQTQLAVERMSQDLQLTLQSRNLAHEVGMEQLQQTGRVELANMDVELQTRLKEMGFLHDFDMSKLDHEEQLQVNSIIQGYDLERLDRDYQHKRRSEHANMAMQAQINYIEMMKIYADPDLKLDANASARVQQNMWDNMVAEYAMINGLYPEQEPITPTRPSG